MTGWLQKLMRISNPFSRRRFSARGKPKALKYTAAFALASLVLLNPVWSSSIRNTASSGDSDERLFVSPAGEPFRTPAFSPYPVVNWFIQADTNQDDELTSRELWHDAERFFAQLDVDRNGIVDAREIRRYESELLPEAAGYEPGQITDIALGEESDETKSRAPALPERSGASPYSLIDIPHPLRLADVDLDRRITAAELATSAVRQIVYLDRNLDHKISRDELPLTPAQKQPERRSFF